MKQYKKTWILSFCLSLLTFGCLAFAFLFFINKNAVQDKAPLQNEQTEDIPPHTEYINPDDNVGSITFTEDRITELARNIYFLDGYLNDINIDLNNDEIIMSAKIKDVDKLCDAFPELKRYKAVLSVIENKDITVGCELINNEGVASLGVTDISIAGVNIDTSIISPFIEDTDFASLFSVDYDSIKVEDGVLVFKNGVPDILDYEN